MSLRRPTGRAMPKVVVIRGRGIHPGIILPIIRGMTPGITTVGIGTRGIGIPGIIMAGDGAAIMPRGTTIRTITAAAYTMATAGRVTVDTDEP